MGVRSLIEAKNKSTKTNDDDDDDDEIKLQGSKQGTHQGSWSSLGLGKGSLRMSDFSDRRAEWVLTEAVEVGRERAEKWRDQHG